MTSISNLWHNRRRTSRITRIFVSALLALQFVAGTVIGQGLAGEHLYPLPSPARIDWYDTLMSRLDPLGHQRGERWPLVLWQGVELEPLERDQIKGLLDRGIVQHLSLRKPDIQAARALDAAGAPIVLMEGAAGAWPYDTVKDEAPWRLQFLPNAKILPQWRSLADATRLAGWRRARDLTRERLRRYKAGGLTVDAVWLDYEGALLHDDYRALRASTAAEKLPDVILDNESLYREYRRTH
ncbi:MAG: hypothetical protein MAG794_01300 [Gammaproteobacteria bacterium]|nr:hypothetical protein [Gammaproteobacteria bacterium]